MKPEHVPVVVIGAGPTGASTAVMLGQRRIRCLVLKRWPEVYPLPRAVHFDDEVFRIFADMDLADEVAAISRPMPGMRLTDPKHRVLAEINRDATSPRADAEFPHQRPHLQRPACATPCSRIGGRRRGALTTRIRTDPDNPLTHERREDTVVPLHRLTRILLGMPNVEDTPAYYTQFGLTPAATDISSIYGAEAPAPTPPSFLAPEDLAALMTGAHRGQ